MKTIFSFFATVFFSANAFTQTSAELTCRAKAKELAMETYSSCITEARNNKVDEIRKNYQKELIELKTKYDRELKKMGASKGPAKSEAPSAKNLPQAPKPVKGIAKELPHKAPSATEAAPVSTVSEGTKVVAVGASEPSNDIENEASQANEPELVEMPTE